MYCIHMFFFTFTDCFLLLFIHHMSNSLKFLGKSSSNPTLNGLIFLIISHRLYIKTVWGFGMLECCNFHLVTVVEFSRWTLLSLQVDLGFLRFVKAIGTQGAISKETKKHYYVRTYKVDLSSNGEDWVAVKDGSKQKVMMSHLFSYNDHLPNADK